MELIDYQLGHDFGVGVDSVSGAVRGDSVIRTTPEEVTGAAGQTVVFQMQQVETTEELTDALSAGAEVNARFGLFNASAKFDFARSTAVNRYSLYLLVSVSVTNSFAQMRDVRLTKGAAELWRSGKADAFREFAGDGCIIGMGRGGLYHAVLQIDSKDEDEREDISAKLEAGYGAFGQGFSAKAQFSKMIASVASERSIKVQHLQIGGADSSAEVGADEMITKATQFAPSVAGDKAVPFSVLIKEYMTLSDLPPQPNKHDLLLAKDVVRSCGQLRLRYLDWINDLDYILAKPAQFAWTNEKEQTRQLGAKVDELREAITELARRASKCANNLSHCEMPSGDATVILDPENIPGRKRRHAGSRPRGKGPRTFLSPKPIPGRLCVPVMRNGRRMWMVMGFLDGSVPDRKRLIIDGTKAEILVGRRSNVVDASARRLMRE